MSIILIVSEQLDQSTNHVMDWISYLNHDSIRIHSDTTIVFGSLKIASNAESLLSLRIEKGREIIVNEIFSYWCRKGTFKIHGNNDIIKRRGTKKTISEAINEHIQDENSALINYIYYFLERKRHLGDAFKRRPNKIHYLNVAHDCGLDIPDSLITGNKNDVLSFVSRHNKIITKAIQTSPSFSHKDLHYYGYTEPVNNEVIKKLPDNFPPALFQEQLEKLYELRIFFIENTFYSMAIFSQNDDSTRVDFRNYNERRPNRCVPYILPLELEKKLIKFINEVKLNTGSIDIVVTKDKKFVFLEVNPSGQFGMISFFCNYNLEGAIANYLIGYENGK